jgi:hypothetical protein
MTNLQLYFAIGVPIISNFLMLTIGFMLINSRISDMGQRITDLRDEMNRRFDAFEAVWRSELRRVEEVLDARLKHLEEHRP